MRRIGAILILLLLLFQLLIVFIPPKIKITENARAALNPSSGWQWVREISISNITGGYQIKLRLYKNDSLKDDPSNNTLDLLMNDNDADLDNLTITDVENPTNGIAEIVNEKLLYTPNENFTGIDEFTYTIEDVNHGSSQATVTVNIVGTNDPPHIYAGKTSDITDKNTSLTFNDANGNKIHITDNDGDEQQVSITITDGTFTLNGIGGLTFTTGDGTADATMVFTGALADINTALDGASFDPTVAFTGTSNISLHTDDQQVGTVAETEDDESISIQVIDPNTAPVVTLPATQTINEDEQITFSNTVAPQLKIDDADGDNQTLTITISKGVLNLSQTTGLSGLTGDGTSNITFSGTLADVNAALNGAIFTPTPNYSGAGSIQVYTKDSKGGDNAATDNLTINDVDEAPVANDDAKTILEDTSVTIYAMEMVHLDMYPMLILMALTALHTRLRMVMLLTLIAIMAQCQ